MARLEVHNTLVELNLGFLKNPIHNGPRPPPPTTPGPDGAREGYCPVARLMVASVFLEGPLRSFPGPAESSGPGLHGRCSQAHEDGSHREALRGDPGTHHQLGALALAPVEAVEAVGEGGRRAQATCGRDAQVGAAAGGHPRTAGSLPGAQAWGPGWPRRGALPPASLQSASSMAPHGTPGPAARVSMPRPHVLPRCSS